MKLMHKLIICAAWSLLLFSNVSYAQAITRIPEFKGGLTPEGIWKIPESAWHSCSMSSNNPYDLNECIEIYMRGYYSPKPAIAFFNYSHGYIDKFQKYGPLAVICAKVHGADHDQAFYILNDEGEFLDVDNYELINHVNLKSDPAYMEIEAKHPNVMLFVGNHNFPQVVKMGLRNNRRFIFTYDLKEGCRACKTVGTVQIGFDYSWSGKFEKVVLIGVAKSK